MNKKLVFSLLMVSMIVAIAGEFVASQKRPMPIAVVPPSEPQPITTTTQPKPTSSIPQTPVVVPPPHDIPVTVTELTPEVIGDRYNATSTSVFGDYPIVAYGTIVPDNKSHPVNPNQEISQLDQNHIPFFLLPSIDGGTNYPYIVSPGDAGNCGDEMGSCQTPVLKIFNSETNKISTLAGDSFISNGISGITNIVYLPNDSALLAMGNGKSGQYAGKFVLYNPLEKYVFKTTNTSTSQAFLFGNFLTSFDPTTNKLSVENLINHDFNSCGISTVEYQKFLAANFNRGHVALNPSGMRIAVFADRLLWMDITAKWQNDSSGNCLDDFRMVSLSNPSEIGGFDLGNWFNNGRFFAVTAYSTNAFLYDFKDGYQAPAMPWSEGLGVGYLNNDGYHNIVDLGYKGFSIQTEINKTNSSVNLYVVGSSQKKSFIKSFSTKLLGIYGDRPTMWIRIFKGKKQENLFHLLVLDGYTFRQFIDVIIK